MMRRVVISSQKKALLRQWAEEFEDERFLQGDPSWFMHQVRGAANQEVMAFLASCLSYGSRPLFLPKIQLLLDWSGGEVFDWVADGGYGSCFPDPQACFYRLYTCGDMLALLRSLRLMLVRYGSMGGYVSIRAQAPTAIAALEALTAWFARHGSGGIIPLDTRSACKRLCMWLRWMVRDGSCVDLGLWRGIVDKRSLIMPLDTHVVEQANSLGLLSSRSTTMAAAQRLSSLMLRVFPDDPLKGDFALFGYSMMGDC